MTAGRHRRSAALALAFFLGVQNAAAQECVLYEEGSGAEGSGGHGIPPFGACLAQYVDPRDGNEYLVRIRKSNAKAIPGEIWSDTTMLENLRYRTANSECLYDSVDCRGYGRVYPAEDLKEACPEGWKPTGLGHGGWFEGSRYDKPRIFLDIHPAFATSVDFLRDSVWASAGGVPLSNCFWLMEGGVKYVADGGVAEPRGRNLMWVTTDSVFKAGFNAMARVFCSSLVSNHVSPEGLFGWKECRKDLLCDRTPPGRDELNGVFGRIGNLECLDHSPCFRVERKMIRKASVRCGKGTHPPVRKEECSPWRSQDGRSPGFMGIPDSGL